MNVDSSGGTRFRQFQSQTDHHHWILTKKPSYRIFFFAELVQLESSSIFGTTPPILHRPAIPCSVEVLTQIKKLHIRIPMGIQGLYFTYARTPASPGCFRLAVPCPPHSPYTVVDSDWSGQKWTSYAWKFGMHRKACMQINTAGPKWRTNQRENDIYRGRSELPRRAGSQMSQISIGTCAIRRIRRRLTSLTEAGGEGDTRRPIAQAGRVCTCETPRPR